MASFSSATRELVLKIVYYGPGLGGKTTTLKALHTAVRPEHRGKMISLATPVDRTLYFDFLPVRLPSVGDVQLRLQLFTVPGQVYFNATRKLVLTGADGVVFVADSQPARLDADVEALDNLRDNLKELGRDFESVPIVLAYNKRDLPGVLDLEALDRELNPHGFPALPTAAASGDGVFESLDAVVRLALDDLARRRVIPSDIAVPGDGTVAARLQDVRMTEPTAPVEPTRIVASEADARSASEAHDVASRTRSEKRSTSSSELAAVAPVPSALPPFPATPVSSASHNNIAAAVASAVAGASANPFATASTAPAVVQPAASLAATTPGVVASAGAASRRASALASLFVADDQETVRTIEDAIGEGILARAALLLEALLVRVLERAARSMGRSDASPESIAWAVGLPPERYARLRSTAQRARQGGDVLRRDVLEAYVLVSLAQITADGLAAGSDHRPQR